MDNNFWILVKENFEPAVYIGAICAGIIYGIFRFFKKTSNETDLLKKGADTSSTSISKKKSSDNSNTGHTIINGDNNTILSNANGNPFSPEASSSQTTKKDIKYNKKILFIDDNPYPIIKLMEKNGWKHVSLISGIESFECDDVKNSDVILVDIIGVGSNLGFQDQGYGLAEALKEMYPLKKIILYSQEKNKFHPAIKKVDLVIEKTSNIYLLEKDILSLFGVDNE